MSEWTLSENSKKFLWIIIILALVALGFHSYLTWSYYGVKYGLAGESLCNINQTFNCDLVSASRFSALFGIPMALWGATVHVSLIVLTLMLLLGMSQNTQALSNVIFYLLGFIALTSVVMGTISVTMIGTYCLFCMATYLTSFINFFLFLKVGPDKGFPNIPYLFSSMRGTLAIIIALPIGGSVLAHNMILDGNNMREIRQIMEDSYAQWSVAPAQTFDAEQGLSIGPADAKMTIVEFADFLCPHCKSASNPIKTFVKSRPDVKLIFKAFPLDGCSGTGLRCSLAKAVYCGKQQNLGWEVHDFIFDHQASWHGTGFSRGIEKMKEAFQFDHDKLMECVQAEETDKAVKGWLKEGRDAGVRATPYIFVNGKYLFRGVMPQVLERVYNSL